MDNPQVIMLKMDSVLSRTPLSRTLVVSMALLSFDLVESTTPFSIESAMSVTLLIMRKIEFLLIQRRQ